MAGYEWSAGKSNNAVRAEREGKMVATRFAAWLRQQEGVKGCTAADVADTLTPCEWHHASKFYSRVNYYDPAEFGEVERAELVTRIAARKAKRRLWKSCGLAALEAGGAWIVDHRELNGTIFIDASSRRARHLIGAALAVSRELLAAGVESIVALPQLGRCYRRTARGWEAA